MIDVVEEKVNIGHVDMEQNDVQLKKQKVVIAVEVSLYYYYYYY
jgi:hypothetical protein